MRELKHVSALVFNEPWLIEPAKMGLICAALEHAMQHGEPWAAPGADPSMKRGKVACEMVGSTAVIPISGVISKKANIFTNISGGASIETIDQQFTAAMADPAVKNILFRVDSPGGAVSGVPEFASKVREACQMSSKPVIAYADGMAASAAYWISAQCDQVYCSEAATVGSIGVVMQVMDNTRMLRNEGVDPVTIRSSELKAPGAGPLTPNQMSSLQDRVMQLFGMFKEAVQAGRPALDVESVASGDVWIGKRAVAMGLADGVCSWEQMLTKLA